MINEPYDGQETTQQTEVIVDNSGEIRINFDLNKFLEKYKEKQISGNDTYYPIVQKDLGVNYKNNIAITGTFKTDFNPNIYTDRGGYCYITIRRPVSGIANVTDGYGIAFRPTTYPDNTKSDLKAEGVYHFTANPYIHITSNQSIFINGIETAFIERDIDGKKQYYPFSFTYDNVNSDLIITAMPENVTIEDGENVNIYVAEPNLFIVDNDSVFADIYQGKFFESRVHTISFIKAKVFPIYPNKLYYYKIVIGDDNSMKVYIDETGAFSSEVISCGARTLSADQVDSNIERTAFGIGILDSGEFRWEFGTITIHDLSGTYAQSYYEFDVSQLADTIQLYIKGYGEGYDGSKKYGLNAYIYNPTTKVWDKIIADVSNSSTTLISEDINRTDYMVDNTVKILVSSAYPSSINGGSALHLDMIKMRSSYNAGVHIGGCVDVYIDDEDLISAEKTITVDSADLINQIDFGQAVVWIDKITDPNDDSIVFLEGVDYRWQHNDDSLVNSSKGVDYIVFREGLGGINVKIHYKYSPTVKLLQTLIDNSEDRFAGQNIIVYHKNIYYLTLEIEQSNQLITNEQIINMLQDYIDMIPLKDNKYTFKYDGFRAYLYTNGITDISKMILTIEYRLNREYHKEVLYKSGDYKEINKNEVFKVKE